MPQTTRIQKGVAVKQQTAGDLNSIVPDHSLNLDKLTVAALNQLIDMLRVPAGVISAFGGVTAPAGWFMCDGSSLLRIDYPELFGAIGTAFGAPNGAEFRVPDFRGRFLRGLDGGSGRDPDVLTRTEMNPGGNVGIALGSVQGHAFQTHSHSYGASAQPHAATGGNPNIMEGNVYQTGSTGSTGPNSQASANETRPVNAYVNFIIKY